MDIKILILILIVSCGFCSCRKQPFYGQENNQERIKIGVPAIPDGWNAVSISSNESTWHNPDFDKLYNSKTPFYSAKYVNYKSGALAYEIDEYFGPNDFQWDGSSFREEIFITYTYRYTGSTFIGIQELNWAPQYSNKDGLLKDISLSEVKRILKLWGLSYP